MFNHRVQRYMILVALVSAAMVFASSLSTPDEHLLVLMSGSVELTFLSLWTLAAIPFAFAMPRLRASFFGRIGRMWHVPSDTYFLPRWIVRFGIGTMIGQVAGILVVAIVRDYRLFWFAGSITLVAAAFGAGARGRLKKHPRTEFTIPWCRFR